MNERKTHDCDEVLVAVMATLDGETPPLAVEQIETHLAGCSRCREAVEPMKALQQQLANVTWRGPAVDVWPAVERQIGRDRSLRHAPWGLALVAAICVAWRIGQLLLDLPLPVVNTVVPLTLSVLLAWWLVGDMLMIDETPGGRQERA